MMRESYFGGDRHFGRVRSLTSGFVFEMSVGILVYVFMEQKQNGRCICLDLALQTYKHIYTQICIYICNENDNQGCDEYLCCANVSKNKQINYMRAGQGRKNIIIIRNATKAKLGKYVPKKRQAKYTIKSETGILR